MEFQQIRHCERFRSRLGFGDLDLTVKVTGEFRGHRLIPITTLEPVDGVSPNLFEYMYITGTAKKLRGFVELVLIFKVTGGLKNEIFNKRDAVYLCL